MAEQAGDVVGRGGLAQLGGAGDALHHQLREGVDVERLRDERVDPAGVGHELLRVRAGAHDDDGQQGVAGVGAQQSVGLGAAEAPQVEVEEDAIGCLLVECFEHGQGRVGVDVDEVVPRRPEVGPQEVGDVVLVLDDHHPLRGGQSPGD